MLWYSFWACFWSWSLEAAHCLAGEEIQFIEERQAVGSSNAHGLLFLKPWEKSYGFLFSRLEEENIIALPSRGWQGGNDRNGEEGIEKANRGTDYI